MSQPRTRIATALTLGAAALVALPVSTSATASSPGLGSPALAAVEPPVVQSVPSTAGEAPMIRLRDAVLDARKGEVAAPPSLAAVPTDGQQLLLVQYSGPIRPAWFEALDTAVGKQGTVVTYVPDNAYLVWTSATGAATLERQADTRANVLYSGPYDPYYRLAPQLRDKAAPSQGTVDVTVQVVSGGAGSDALSTLTQDRQILRAAYDLAGLTTISVRVPTAQLDDIVSLAPVVNVEPYAAPELNDEVQDQLLAGNVTTVGGKTVATGPGYLAWLDAHAFPHTPASYPKVVVVDDGIDEGDTTPLHPDFYETGSTSNPSRLTSNDDCTADPAANGVGGHGNLNAGIVGGYNDGTGTTNVDPNGYHYGLGVNPFGRLGGIKIFRNDGSFDISACAGSYTSLVQTAYAAGAGFTTNSWGAPVGGAYNADSQAWDALVRDASSTTVGNQEMLHIFSAGNSGPGVNTIGSPGTAKNVLTVGATENVRDQGTLDGCNLGDGDSDSDIAGFSSRGPTDDGRTKPDLVAAGTHVQGPASQDPGFDASGVCGPNPNSGRYYPAGQTMYTWSSGTSHSTPAVAGAVSLVQNYYGRVLTAGQTASPAMLKALIANTPRYLAGGVGTGDTLPSNNQGLGVPDLGALFETSPHRVLVDESQLLTATGQQRLVVGNVTSGAKPVRVTLAWSDAIGPTVGNAYVNNLDLVVTAGGQTYRGNVFGANGLSATGGGADVRNNLENVFLPAGTTGPITVKVVGTNISGDAVPLNGSPLDQDYALTVSNMDVVPQPVASAGGLSATESDFDSNATIDPGEVVNVTATVASVGDQPLAAGSGTLSVGSGPATVLAGTSAYPVIPTDSSAVNRTAYQVRINPVIDCNTDVVLDHTYTAGGGQQVVQHLTLRLGGPGSPVTVSSPDVPKAIPDNAPSGTTSTTTLAGSANMTALKVTVSLTHTFDSDLVGTLTSPLGKVVTLMSKNGSSGDNFTNTVFDDGAATGIGAGSAPFTGSFRPTTPLSVMDGEPIAGNWTLKLVDTASADVGTLSSWSMQYVPSVPRVCSAAVPTLRIAPPTDTPENAGPVDVAVTLLNPDAGSHSATFTPTTNGSATAPGDFDATPIALTWNPGDPATKHLSIPLVSDGVAEPEETFVVGATASDTAVSSPVVARILPPVVIATASVAAPPAVSEGGTLSFPVTLSGADPGTSYSVHVATGGGTATAGADYTPVSQDLTWNPGDPATRQVTVPTATDAADEPAETVTLTLSSPGVGVVLGTSSATGTINDVAPPPAVLPKVTIKKAKVTEGDKGKRKLVFQVSLSAPSATPVSFSFKTQDQTALAGKDYKKASGTLTIPAGATTGSITVLVKGDTKDEVNEKLRLVCSGIVNALFGGKTTLKGKILDDD